VLPLILIPGLLSTAALWDCMRGHLPQAWPIQALGPLDQPAIGDMAEAILSDAPPAFALCGHSMGGYVCLELIRRAPERVRALVLVNTSARPDTPEQRQVRLDATQLAQRGRFVGVSRRFFPRLVAERARDDAGLLATVQAMAAEVGAEGFVTQQHLIMGRPDSRPDLAQISCPTLVVGGREDQVTSPALSVEMYEEIPHCDLHLLSDCGHLAPLERPQRLARLLISLLEDAQDVSPALPGVSRDPRGV
jgi:pimeloyl-ACP methyl ester carboxylesterase